MSTPSASKNDSGKLRYDLEPVFAREQIIKVLTHGANEYGANNWRQGFKWGRLIAAMERHLKAFKEGEDFDPDTGLFHLAHLGCNVMFALEFYRVFPQGDDRIKKHFAGLKIGLDIDEVLCDFIPSYTKRFGVPDSPESWSFDPNIKENLEKTKNDEEWYLNMPMKITPREIPFEPHCYITSRMCPKEVTIKWLHKNGYPIRPVYVVAPHEDKVKAAKESGIDIFVDDRFDNFLQLNKAGICCYLLSAPHNERFKNIGFKRIDSLHEILEPKDRTPVAKKENAKEEEKEPKSNEKKPSHGTIYFDN